MLRRAGGGCQWQSNDPRNLGFAVVALVGFAAMLVWVLIAPPGDDGANQAEAREAETASAPEPSAAQAPARGVAGARAASPAQPAPAPTPALDVDLFAG